MVSVAVVGCGWWAQGWHLPHLAANPDVKITAVVDPTIKPISTLSSSPLLSLSELSIKYGCEWFTCVSDLIKSDVVERLDGIIISTSHASHFEVGMAFLKEGIRRREESHQVNNDKEGEGSKVVHRVINILMEKPMTTDVHEAQKLWEMSAKGYPEGAFIINHTASYRPQARVARQIIATNQIGKILHIAVSMNGPLMWLFNDALNHSWVSPTPWKKNCGSSVTEDEKSPMAGNGYAYGQIAHVLAWVYCVLDADVATPSKVYCSMSHAPNTGADVSFAAVITCKDGVTFSLAGTALLPGSQYAHPPIGKLIRIELFGEEGSLMYGGDDKIPQSGRLELRKKAASKEDGKVEYLSDGFYFEDGEQEGTGPGSMKSFLDACRASSMHHCQGKVLTSSSAVKNDSLIGLRTVQIIDAMYRSSVSGSAEAIDGEIV